MARPRNMPQKDNEQPSTLLEALRFISIAQKFDDKLSVTQNYCTLRGNWVFAYDGALLAAGAPIQETIDICPHTETFVEAISKCGQHFSLTQLDNGRVKVNAAKSFSAFVPCLNDPGILPVMGPDAQIGVVNDSLKASLDIVGNIAKDNATRFIEATVFVRANTAVATDGSILMESWHGIDLPPMCLPKAAVTALCKVRKPLTGFGYSGQSATFYYEDGSWIRTQFFSDPYPNVDRLLKLPSECNPWPIPVDFVEGVKAVAPFNNGTIVFGQDGVRSHVDETTGGKFTMQGLPKGIAYNAKYLLMASPYMKAVDFAGPEQRAFFFGDNVRGIIMQMAVK